MTASRAAKDHRLAEITQPVDITPKSVKRNVQATGDMTLVILVCRTQIDDHSAIPHRLPDIASAAKYIG